MPTILEEFSSYKDADVYDRMIKDILTILDYGLETQGGLHAKPLITYRIKEENSLAGKLKKKGDKYKSINDITDIVGIRIITYFQDDVDIIKKMMLRLFSIDLENTIDKRYYIGNSFGYASLHLVASVVINQFYQYAPFQAPGVFPDTIIKKLNNVSDYKGIKFEIQIRTVLEHAWAEIEHDLGYKSNLPGGLPLEIKRGVARLAATLETADTEFLRLRKELEKYVKSATITEDTKAYSEQKIIYGEDPYNIFNYFYNSPQVRRIEDKILELNQKSRSSHPPDRNMQFRCYKAFSNNGLDTVEELHNFIAKNENEIIELAIDASMTEFGYERSVKGSPMVPQTFLAYYVALLIIAMNSKSSDDITKGLIDYFTQQYKSAPLGFVKIIEQFNSRRR